MRRAGASANRRASVGSAEKKTSLSRAGLDGHLLAQRYEVLRQAVVDCDTAQGDVRGISVLMRRGVAGWMHAVAADAAAVPRDARAKSAARSSTLEQLLVNIVAAMALVHAKELIA